MPDYLLSDDFMRDFACGDRKAFGALFDEYFPKLVVFAKKVTNDYQVAEDIASEALAELMLKHVQWSDKGMTVQRMGGYLFIAVRHKCIDYLRSFRKKTGPNRFEASEVLAGAEVASVEEAIIYSEVVSRIVDGLMDLPREKRRALELVFYQDKSYAEAAQALGVPLSTFKFIRKGGLSQMAKRLTKKDLVTTIAVILACLAKVYFPLFLAVLGHY
jgi:RNA polymerase sigma-70 factor (ECF subfamily)